MRNCHCVILTTFRESDRINHKLTVDLMISNDGQRLDNNGSDIICLHYLMIQLLFKKTQHKFAVNGSSSTQNKRYISHCNDDKMMQDEHTIAMSSKRIPNCLALSDNSIETLWLTLSRCVIISCASN